MKKIIITKYGPPSVLKVQEKRNPHPKEDEVLIRNQYTGINFSEIMARMRLYPGAPKPPSSLGAECCGIIESIGKNVSGFSIGDKVMAFARFNSYSTHVLTKKHMVMKLPNQFSLKEGAAFPVIYITAYMMMHHLGNLQSNESILIHGAGGGVGTAAIQLAKAVNATIIGTASDWKHKKILSLGAHHCIDYNKDDVYNKIMKITGNRGVDLILDPVGSNSWKTSYKCLAGLGKLIIYGDQNFVNGNSFSFINSIKEIISIPKFKPFDLMSQNKSVMGYHLGRLHESEIKVNHAVEALSKLAEKKIIKPVIDKIFPFQEADKAHQYIQNRKNFGKVLLDFR